MVCVVAPTTLCTVCVRHNRSDCFRNIGYMDMIETKEREVVTVLRYHRRSEIQTDEEYLEANNNI